MATNMIIDSSKLHISMITNELFVNLANVSCSSFNNSNIIVHLNKIDVKTNTHNNGLFSESWYECLEKKIIFADFLFKHMQYNDVLLVCDADVYCFNADNVFALKDYLHNQNLDMVGMADYFDQYYEDNPTERLKINCGFFLIRKTKNSKDFFNKILLHNFTSFQFGEQDIVNEIILKQNHGLNYRILCPTEYVMGCHLDRVISEANKNISILHTTCTHNLQEKQQQINKAIKHYGFSDIEWTNAQLTKKEVISYNV